jgi:hypothetical protein
MRKGVTDPLEEMRGEMRLRFGLNKSKEKLEI